MRPEKLVVLDGYTLNPGDLSWDELRSLVPVAEIHDRTPPEAVLERATGANLLLTNKVRLPREILSSLPDLKYIGVLATGFDVVDVAAAGELGIVVSNVPAYSTPSVVQMVIGFILHWSCHIAHHSRRVGEGAWSESEDFSFWDFPLHEVAGKTLGIIGFGRIGQQVGRVAHHLGMNIIATVRSPKQVDYPVEYVSMDEVFERSDFLSLLCPLTPETRGLVNAARLTRMKSTAYLINTARGPVVVEDDLAAALKEGRIAGAGMDVLSTEPPPDSHPLLSAPNVVITPHYAWATVQARSRLMQTTIANLRGFLAGNPQNVVSGVISRSP